MARESWRHLRELWPLAWLGSFGDVGSFLAVFMKTKGSVGFHIVSEIAAGGAPMQEVLGSVLHIANEERRKNTAGVEDQLGDRNPPEEP